MFHIKQIFIGAQHPASNGLVKRMNEKILESFCHFADTLHETRVNWLPTLATSTNDSVNPFRDKAPLLILFGSDKRSPNDLLLQSPLPLYNLGNYSSQLNSFQAINSSVCENLKASQKMLYKQYSQTIPITISVGDSVLKSLTGHLQISSQVFSPYLVTSKMHGNKLKILDPSLNILDHLNILGTGCHVCGLTG